MKSPSANVLRPEPGSRDWTAPSPSSVTAEAKRRNPKVALASVGLGRIRRGYERYFSDLFSALQSELDVTIYKSAGPAAPGERVPPLFRAASAITRRLPLGRVGAEYEHYKHECLAFALSLLPDLLTRRYDVLHVIDYPLERALDVLQRIFRFKTRLLFTNGMGMPPRFYPRAAHVHHVAGSWHEEALRSGFPPARVSMIPCGIRCDDFETAASRSELRRKHGISDEVFVILAVTAVKRAHKRVDHIIKEVSRLEGDILLWIDGRPEDADIPELARETLGSRCRITYSRTEDVPELYSVADVLVHAALDEVFGLSVTEALSTGLMVLTHDSPHFEWLLGDREFCVDMERPGALAARLADLMHDREALAQHACERKSEIRRRFDWDELRPAYVEMYRRVAGFERTIREA